MRDVLLGVRREQREGVEGINDGDQRRRHSGRQRGTATHSGGLKMSLADRFESSGGVVVRSPRNEEVIISSVEGWFDEAPPLGRRRHWKDGRSAKEVAKAWCASGTVAVPADLLTLVRAHRLTEAFEPATAIPECPTHLRGEAGGRRKHDLVILGMAASRRVLIGVEAKTDEPFDEPLKKRVRRAQGMIARGEPTNQLKRIERLVWALFDRPAFIGDTLEPALAPIPYQLISGLAGTLYEADNRGADLAVFAIHTFHSAALDAAAVSANRDAVSRFAALIAGGQVDVKENELYGPGMARGTGVPPVPFLLGWTTTLL